MHTHTPQTHFAPSERASQAEIARQRLAVSQHIGRDPLIDHAPIVTMVLNRHRQIVFANKTSLDALGVPDSDFVIDRRPGEALRCVNSESNPGGCGTATPCAECGAVLAIMGAIETDTRQVRECRVTTRRENGYPECAEFQIVADPMNIGQERLICFSATDISAAKRRANLEEVFVHDLRNLTTALTAHLQLLRDNPTTLETRLPAMMSLSRGIADALDSQRVLIAAENKTLVTRPTLVSVSALLKDVADVARATTLAATRTVEVIGPMHPATVRTDSSILQRALDNLCKNALEATPSRGSIRIGCEVMTGGVEFWVHNTAPIPESAHNKIFARYFSTKGASRGLGTYGARLLVERYLRGSVGFTSSADSGTRFFVRLPSE